MGSRPGPFRVLYTQNSKRHRKFPVRHSQISKRLGSCRNSTYLAATDHTLVLVVAKRAFIADADEGRWSHITIADRAFAIALVAKTSYSNSGLLAAHHKITAVGVSWVHQGPWSH